MTWLLSGDRPIYIQLVEQMERMIVSGEYAPGERLKSVRDLAAEAAVNPNTMQKALAELEARQLIHTQRTSGRFITEDAQQIKQVKEKLAMEQITAFIERMQKLGFDKREILDLMMQVVKEELK